MTSYIEFEGKNIEQAVKKACGKLKIDKDKIRYKVISHGSTGIFGLVGRKKAKINVSVPEVKKPEEKRPEKRPEKKIDNKEADKESFDNKESELRENNVQTGKEVLQKIIDSITEDAKITIASSVFPFFPISKAGFPPTTLYMVLFDLSTIVIFASSVIESIIFCK
ncbi:unnamed protein product, partial [marine sediment metagenome]